MNKVIHPADVPEWDGKKYPMFCRIEFKDGRLSITGVIGPRRGGDCAGSAGQIDVGFDHADKSQNDRRTSDPIKAGALIFAKGWNAQTWHKFLDAWHRWHLNDMKAGCEHMDGWDTSEELTLTPLKPGKEYHRMRRLAEDGELTPLEYEQYSKGVKLADSAWLHNKPSHPELWSDEVRILITSGWLEVDKPEKKNAGWVYPSQHPGGLLTKECPECGYKYGSAWRKREVPADVIEFLESLPDTDVQPAWV